MYDAVLRAGSRLNLPLQALPDKISGQKWDLAQAPPRASPWVNDLCMHIQMFRDRLGQVRGLSDTNLTQARPTSQKQVTVSKISAIPCILLWSML